ncbi:hypothetical protein GCM10009839_32430 [Catenulispora yoronensis]|uniref:Glycosyltransferase RgtA/B/C/D-like domain-containing protein n=1 Tax=Catenulispora yoronensis TaxID=450799 RepID=A0ABN2U6N8_9ACTN
MDTERGTGAPVAEPWAQRAPAADFDLYRVAMAGLAAIGCVLTFVLIRFTVDDAFIAWRYGQNLVHGVWNWNVTAQNRVEAYSDPAYAALSALPAAVGLPAEPFYKLLSLAFVAGYLAVVRSLPVPPVQRLLLVACVLANPIFFVHLFSGLETAVFALLIAWLFGLLYTRGRIGFSGYLIAAALGFTRPEGILYSLVAVVWCYHLTRRRADAVAGIALASGLAVYWAMRAMYFSSFFPNSYHVKSGSWLADPAVLSKAGADGGRLLVVLAVGIAFAETARRLYLGRLDGAEVSSAPVSPWRDVTPAVLAAVSALVFVLLYHQSALSMDFGNRFRWQVLFPVPLVLLSRPLSAAKSDPGAPGSAHAVNSAPSARWSGLAVAICALTAFIAVTPDQVGAGLAVLAALTAGVCAAVVWISGKSSPVVVAAVGLVIAVSTVSVNQVMDWASYRYHLRAAHQAIGKAIASDPTLSGVIAATDVGVFSNQLRPDQQVLDLSGIADPFYSRQLPAAQTDRLVALVVGATDPYQGSPWWGDTSTGPVLRQADAGHFRLAGSVMYGPGYWMRVYIKPGVGEQAAAALPAIAQAASAWDSVPSGRLLAQHLFDLPFLRG